MLYNSRKRLRISLKTDEQYCALNLLLPAPVFIVHNVCCNNVKRDYVSRVNNDLYSR